MNPRKALSTLGLALAACALLASPAFAETSGDQTHQGPQAHHGAHALPGDHLDDDTAFEHMVRGIDLLPTRQQMEDRWPDAEQRLIDVATDSEATPFERLRATSMLANFVGPTAERALLEVTADDNEDLRAIAYYTLGRFFLTADGDALFDHLLQGLNDDATAVQADILRSFRWTDHPGTLEVLQRYAGDEQQSTLQSIARRALDRR